MRLLLAEMDSGLAESLIPRLQRENFVVQVISHVDQVSQIPQAMVPDLVLLDTNVSARPGTDRLRVFLNRWPESPVVLLLGDKAVEERVKLLNAGADDVLAKPFALAELVARAHAVLRRRARSLQDVLTLEDLQVNRISHEVSRAGRPIELSRKEYALLEFLLRSPGQPVARAAIIEQVWQMQTEATTNVVDVYINYLRRKIDTGSDCPLIRTIRGIGYQIGGNHCTG